MWVLLDPQGEIVRNRFCFKCRSGTLLSPTQEVAYVYFNDLYDLFRLLPTALTAHDASADRKVRQ